MATEAPRDDLPFADRRPELWCDGNKCSKAGLLSVNKVSGSFRHDNDTLGKRDTTFYKGTSNRDNI